jgi:hypothetical protein
MICSHTKICSLFSFVGLFWVFLFFLNFEILKEKIILLKLYSTYFDVFFKLKLLQSKNDISERLRWLDGFFGHFYILLSVFLIFGKKINEKFGDARLKFS